MLLRTPDGTTGPPWAAPEKEYGSRLRRVERVPLGKLKTPMTYIVTETCVDLKDKHCIEVCPVDCIHEASEDRMVFIDPDECIDCGACVDPCPVDAIYAEEDVPAPQVVFTKINKIYFHDQAAGRQQVDGIKPPA